MMRNKISLVRKEENLGLLKLSAKVVPGDLAY